MDYAIMAASAALTVASICLAFTARRRRCRVLPDETFISPRRIKKAAQPFKATRQNPRRGYVQYMNSRTEEEKNQEEVEK